MTSLLWLFGITAIGLLLFLVWGVWKGWIMSDKCYWEYSDYCDSSYWETTCGNSFVITDGKPSENDMYFCCYCGKKLIEVLPEIDIIEDYGGHA